MWYDISRLLANNNYGFVRINILPDYQKMSSRGRNYPAINENEIILTFFFFIYIDIPTLLNCRKSLYTVITVETIM